MNQDQKILPVPEAVSRPFLSVIIPVYNRTKFVRQAFESVRAKDSALGKLIKRIVGRYRDCCFLWQTQNHKTEILDIQLGFRRGFNKHSKFK
jgi:hypothetical protein